MDVHDILQVDREKPIDKEHNHIFGIRYKLSQIRTKTNNISFFIIS